MTSVAPAKNGAFMHIPTKTPRVHGLTTPTHARRRAGHPLAGGRLGKQNAVRAILGRLVSSSRKNMSILEDAVRQAYSLHYKTNSLIISRIIRLELVVDYQPDYQLNYQPDYQPGSTEVPAW